MSYMLLKDIFFQNLYWLLNQLFFHQAGSGQGIGALKLDVFIVQKMEPFE